MTDLEMTRLCAEALGLPTDMVQHDESGPYLKTSRYGRYQPLHDDAQAMELQKRFRFDIRYISENWWGVGGRGNHWSYGPDLNRAIVECVAKMQSAKVKNGEI